MAQAVVDPSFVADWQLQWWSCASPCRDRRKHLTCHALAERAAAMQHGTICKHSPNLVFHDVGPFIPREMILLFFRQLRSTKIVKFGALFIFVKGEIVYFES